jgi:L-amino acid N-acyltransferase YncA
MEIRFARVEDAAEITAIYRPYVEGTVISFELTPPDDADMAGRIARVIAELPWLVCEEAGAIVGYAYASRHRDRAAYRWSVDTSVYVHEAQRRRGLGHALYTELLVRLRDQGYYTAYAGITLPNAASVALHERFGFEPVGIYRKAGFKLGRWWDVGWWQKPLRSYVVPTAMPTRSLRT